jgi:ABC-type glycerol-3-phosphate transport system substrate-binding protein
MGPFTQNEDQLQQTMIAAFAKLYPNINVTYQFYDWGSVQAQVSTAAQAGAYDVYWLDEVQYFSFSPQADLFADISSYVNDPSWASEKAHFSFWDRIQRAGPRLIGIPYEWNALHGLYVNLDMLGNAGYGLEVVQSRDKLLQAWLKLTKVPDVYGILMAFTAETWYFYQDVLLQGGTDFLSPDLKSVALKTADSLRAANWVADLFTKHKVAAPVGLYNYSTAPDAFVGQKCAMLAIDASIGVSLNAKGDAVKFKWDWVPFPGETSNASLSTLGFLAMGAQSPAKDATWEMMKFWAAAPQNANWCDYSGVYPVRDDAQANGYGAHMPQQTVAALPTFLKIAQGQQSFPKLSDCEITTIQEFGRALTGEVTAEQAMDACVTDVQRIVFG